MRISISHKSLYPGQISCTDDRPRKEIEITNTYSRKKEENLCAGCGAPVRGDESYTFCDNCR